MQAAEEEQERSEAKRQLHQSLLQAAIPRSRSGSRDQWHNLNRELSKSYNHDDFYAATDDYNAAVDTDDYKVSSSSSSSGNVNFTQYALKYIGCQNVKSWSDSNAESDSTSPFAMQSLVVLRMCPSTTCSAYNTDGCLNNYGEYLLPMLTYVTIMQEYHLQSLEKYCSTCSECMSYHAPTPAPVHAPTKSSSIKSYYYYKKYSSKTKNSSRYNDDYFDNGARNVDDAVTDDAWRYEQYAANYYGNLYDDDAATNTQSSSSSSTSNATNTTNYGSRTLYYSSSGSNTYNSNNNNKNYNSGSGYSSNNNNKNYYSGNKNYNSGSGSYGNNKNYNSGGNSYSNNKNYNSGGSSYSSNKNYNSGSGSYSNNKNYNSGGSSYNSNKNYGGYSGNKNYNSGSSSAAAASNSYFNDDYANTYSSSNKYSYPWYINSSGKCAYKTVCENYSDSCKSQSNSSASLDLTFLKCAAYKDAGYYTGPHCAADGHTIEVGLYMDSSCSNFVKSAGSDSSFAPYTDKSCILCSTAKGSYTLTTDENLKGASKDTNPLCTNLYGTSARCNAKLPNAASLSKASNEKSVCSFIEAMHDNNYNEYGEVFIQTDFQAANWKRTSEYIKLAKKANSRQLFLLTFTMCVAGSFSAYAIYLHKKLYYRQAWVPPVDILETLSKDDSKSAAGRISRLNSGILAMRSLSYEAPSSPYLPYGAAIPHRRSDLVKKTATNEVDDESDDDDDYNNRDQYHENAVVPAAVSELGQGGAEDSHSAAEGDHPNSEEPL